MKSLDPERLIRNCTGPDGRLKLLPVKPAKRQVILAHLAGQFEMDCRYPERAVNEILKRFHDDYCTLRRELVDHGYLDRAGGEYWRASP
ncbi:MAG TPA: DUF2087 domain-containing protein [Symbiobacteriaceae bacterium]|nr:DUF2087 domain-containing protein [Symbiobacteriaceae bacterium]